MLKNMKIIIRNYRCYLGTYEFMFQNGMNILQGPSGAGKSTVLSAILWCLYGKERSITPKGFTGRTQVTFQTSHFQVDRYNNTRLLKVTLSNEELIDDKAQAFINSQFSDIIAFKSTSTIHQKQYNSFFYLSQKERSYFLDNFSGSPDDFETYLLKIDTIIKELQDQLNVLNYQVSLQESNIKTNYSNINPPQSDDFNKQQLLDQIKILQEQEKVYQDKLVQIKTIDGKILSLEQLKSKIPHDITDKIKNTEKLLSLSHIDDLIKQAKVLQSTKPVDDPQLTPEEESILRIYTHNQCYDFHYKNQSMMVTLKTKYGINNINELKDRIKFIENLKKNKMIYDNIYQKRELERKLASYPLLESLEYYQKNLEYNTKLEQYKKIIRCPHCNNTVKISGIGSELSLCKGDHVPEMEQQGKIMPINQIYQLIIQCKEKADIIDKLKLIPDIPSDFVEEVNSIKLLNEYLDSLKPLNDILSFYSSLPQEIPPDPNRYQALANKQQSKPLYETYITSRTKLQEILDEITLTGQNMDKLLGPPRDMLISELSKYNTMFDHVESFNNQINHLRKEKELITPGTSQDHLIASLRSKLILREQQDKLVDLLNSYLLAVNNRDIQQLKLKNYLIFKEEIQKIEIEVISFLIDEINQWLDEILPDIFDDRILVKLEMMKMLKTTKRIKPEVYFKVLYKGIESENIDSLSGGEADRLSLALTIAFHKISGSRILFLDECLNSLNEEIRNNVLLKIKGLVPDSTVICTYHGETSEIFDHYVDIPHI